MEVGHEAANLQGELESAPAFTSESSKGEEMCRHCDSLIHTSDGLGWTLAVPPKVWVKVASNEYLEFSLYPRDTRQSGMGCSWPTKLCMVQACCKLSSSDSLEGKRCVCVCVLSVCVSLDSLDRHLLLI